MKRSIDDGTFGHSVVRAARVGVLAERIPGGRRHEEPGPVASCKAMGDVHASDLTPDYDIQRDLTEAVRNRGANTLLIAKDGARVGTAYQCSMPEATAPVERRRRALIRESPSGSGRGRAARFSSATRP